MELFERAAIYSRKNGNSNKWNFGASVLAKQQNGTWMRAVGSTYRDQ